MSAKAVFLIRFACTSVRQLDVERAVTAVCGPISIVENTLHRLTQQIYELEHNLDRPEAPFCSLTGRYFGTIAFKTISRDGFAVTSFRRNSLPASTSFRCVAFIRDRQAAQGQRDNPRCAVGLLVASPSSRYKRALQNSNGAFRKRAARMGRNPASGKATQTYLAFAAVSLAAGIPRSTRGHSWCNPSLSSLL